MLVILDRDGVINSYEEGQYICRPEDWIPIPGSIEAIASLSNAGYQIAIATNQSGVGRGYYSEDVLQAMHDKLIGLVEKSGGRIDHIAWCPHLPDAQCDCRKPAPGLLQQIQSALDLPTLEGSWMVGDNRKDLEAGLSAHCHPVLVRTGNGTQTEAALKEAPLPGVKIFDDLSSFARYRLAQQGQPS